MKLFNLCALCLFMLFFHPAEAQDSLVKYHFSNGVISSQGMLRLGKPEGYWRNFYEDGTLRSEGKMHAGKTDSTWNFYNTKGTLITTINFKKGLKNGHRETYNEKGEIIIRESFVNDQKEGVSTQFYPDGSPRINTPFHHDKEDGRGFEFDQKGKIIVVFDYSKGLLTARKPVNRFDLSGKQTGIWIEVDTSGVVRKEINYQDGQVHGYIKWFNQLGQLLKVEHYIMGKLQGEPAKAIPMQVFYKNKQLKTKGSFLNGKPVGMQLRFDSLGGNAKAAYYDQQGKLLSEGKLDSAEQRTGYWKEFYPEGNLKAEGSYLKGQKVAQWKYYHDNGQLEQYGMFVNGKPDGIWKWFYEDGQLFRETNYLKGKEDGFSFELDKYGDTLSRGEFLDDEREGPWLFKQGYLLVHGAFIAGKPHGLWVYKDTTGNLRFEGNFLAGEGQGTHRAYFENAKIRWTGAYLNGKRNGTWILYKPDGSIVIEVEYREGLEIKYDGLKIRPEFEPDEWESMMQHNPYIF